MDIQQFERIAVGHLPTPFAFLPRLTQHLGGPNIYVKRDDCTGLAGGGNKVRKLEFLLGDALKQGADTIITQGAIQSNHTRQTAAICASLGLACHVLLEDRTGQGDVEFYANGNVLLDQIFGAHVQMFPGGTDMNQQMSLKAHTLAELGKHPYIIPGGGSNSIGALGYALAAQEILSDAKTQGIALNHIIQATGSAGTHAGLVAGLHCLNQQIPVTGISVRFEQTIQHEKVFGLAKEVLARLDDTLELPPQAVKVDDRFIGEGYGIPGPDTLEAIRLFAHKEGLLLDPVYTGKAAAGLIQLIQEGFFTKGQNVVFLHTGGAQSLPGFREYFDFPVIEKATV